MTRETKIGLLVTVSFLSLVGIVLYSKMKDGRRLSEDDSQAEITIPPEPAPSTAAAHDGGAGTKPAEPATLPNLVRSTSVPGSVPEPRSPQSLPGLPGPGVQERIPSNMVSENSAGAAGRGMETSMPPLPPPPLAADVTQKEATLPGSSQPHPLPPSAGADDRGSAVRRTAVVDIPVWSLNGLGGNKKTESGSAGTTGGQASAGGSLPGPLPGTGAGPGSGARLTGVDTAGTSGAIKAPEPPPLISAQPSDKKLEAPGPLPGAAELTGVVGGKTSTGSAPAALPPAMKETSVDLGKPQRSASTPPTGDTSAPAIAQVKPVREVPVTDVGTFGAKTLPLPPLGASAGAVTPPLTAALPAAAGRSTPTSQVESYDEETYRLRPGDTLQDVSQRFYHTDKYAQALLRFNRDHPLADNSLRVEPVSLQPNQALYLPPTEILEKRYASLIPNLGAPAAAQLGRESRASPAATGVTQASAIGPKTVPYTVKAGGEKMWAIASRTLGKGERWTQIRDLNGGYDPIYAVPAGTVLQLPADAKP